MNRIMRHMLLPMALALAIAAPASGQEDRVQRMITIFTDTCAQFPGAPDEMRPYVAARYEPFSPADERRLLGGRSGRMWHTPERDRRTQYAIYSYDDGECAVIAGDMPSNGLRGAFSKLMTKLASYGRVEVEQESDIKQGDPANEIRTLTYVARNPNAARGVKYILITKYSKAGETAWLSALPSEFRR